MAPTMTHATPIRAVVFDLDGLMFDTEALFFRAASEMLRDRGKVFTVDIMRAMIGRQPAASGLAFRTMAGLDEEPEALMAEAKGRFEALLDSVRPMPGLIVLLDHLRAFGLPLAVGTSSGRAYAERLLSGHGLLDRFAFVLCREDVTLHKPDPEIYRTAAAKFGLEPAEVLVLEDTPTGLAAAKAAGTFAVGVPHDHSPEADLAGADLIARSLDDPALLTRIAAGRARSPNLEPGGTPP
jgi:HAD superfamily hydrolase (TIGR01509 family)